MTQITSCPLNLWRIQTDLPMISPHAAEGGPASLVGRVQVEVREGSLQSFPAGQATERHHWVKVRSTGSGAQRSGHKRSFTNNCLGKLSCQLFNLEKNPDLQTHCRDSNSASLDWLGICFFFLREASHGLLQKVYRQSLTKKTTLTVRETVMLISKLDCHFSV